tara:strand:- start:635 stop:1483 length:849 start_codon:yes stop_codon:yes gene_type:complete
MDGKISYELFHSKMLKAKDIDPSILCLKYLSDRFELNLEQRYWIAFLYGCTYCSPTVFYIYNEFPDYQNINIKRMSKWWNENKSKLIFQTDRLRIKSNNQFISAVESYKKLCGGSQRKFLNRGSVKEIYNRILQIKFFGRFSLFNYLDVLNSITDIDSEPRYLNMNEAISCRNGVAYSLERLDLMNHKDKKKLNKSELELLHNEFVRILRSDRYAGNVFQIETTLCAYKKYRLGKRYVGYYIDRMYNEIKKMSENVPEGVYWNVLWEFRNETFDKKYLKENR